VEIERLINAVDSYGLTRLAGVLNVTFPIMEKYTAAEGTAIPLRPMNYYELLN